MTHEVTDFAKDVLERSSRVPVLVDFWAEWCGPCKVLGPVLERLAEKSDGRWVLAKVDTDKNQDIARQYGIRGIPNVKLFVDGKVTSEFTGALPERGVVQWLEKALPNRYLKDIEKAEQLILDNRTDEGRKLLEEVLIKEPNNELARVRLGGTYLLTDRKKALSLVKDIEEHTAFFPLAESIRTIVLLTQKLEQPETLPQSGVRQVYLDAIRDLAHGNYDSALKGFIEVIRTDRYYDDDGSRKACIAIFKVLGEEHRATREYRREFGGALNR
jgi:putative thioredoxin